jgi:hypothetical protein
MLFKFEIMDHKARERAGLIIPTFSAPIPVILKFDSAMEVNILIFTCYSKSFLTWSSKVLIMINFEIYLRFKCLYLELDLNGAPSKQAKLTQVSHTLNLFQAKEPKLFMNQPFKLKSQKAKKK